VDVGADCQVGTWWTGASGKIVDSNGLAAANNAASGFKEFGSC
jgi:hypothetical protein